MSEFQFNCMTQADWLMLAGSRRHTLDIYNARARRESRAANREYRRQRRQKIADKLLNISLGITIAVSVLVAVGVLTTAVS